MQLENKAKIPQNQENNDQLLPQKELVQLIPEVSQNVPQKKQPTISWGAVKIFLSIFLIGYGINWLRFDVFPSIALCGGVVSADFEGQYKTGAMNRAQQAYFLNNQKFTENFQQLDFGFTPKTSNFKYSIRTEKNKAVFHYGIASPDAYKLRTKYFGPFWWSFKEPLQLKSYVGAVFTVPNNNLDKTKQKKMSTVDVVCSSLHSSSTIPIAPKLVKGVPTCGAGTKERVR